MSAAESADEVAIPTDLGSTRPGWLRRNAGTLILFFSVFVVHALSPNVQIGDSRLSAATAWRFLTHFDLHLQYYPVVSRLPVGLDQVQVDGNTLPYFPWPTMLLAIPAAVLLLVTGRTAADLSIVDPAQTYLVEIPTAALLVALTTVVLLKVVRALPWLNLSPRVAMLSALVFAFGTSAWSVGSRALWQQTASMLWLSLALLCCLRLTRNPRVTSAGWQWILGATLALAAISRPTDAVIAALFIVWIFGRARFAVLRAGLAFVVVLALFCAFSYSQYRSLIPPYYLPNRMADNPAVPFVESLGLNIFSPSRGLVIFNPVFILAVAGIVLRIRRQCFTALDLLMCVAIVLQWLIIAKFGSTGGTVYGPRLMIDIVPFLVVLAAPTLTVLTDGRPAGTRPWPHRLAVAGVVVVLVWGFLVSATGALIRDSRCWNVVPVNVDAAPARIWDWSDPQFLRPYLDLADGHSVGWVLRGTCTAEI